MKVLSIDFDYFVQTTPEILTYGFPDGHDFSGDLSSIIWSSYYQDKSFKTKVKLNEPEFEKMKSTLQSLSEGGAKFVSVGVTYSHKELYDLIQLFDDTKEDIQIINIDTHHDLYQNGSEIDCGNWMSYIKEEYSECDITWVRNPEYVSLYDNDVTNGITQVDSIDAISEEKDFDLIFLCRSDMWLPPHLDKAFAELGNLIKEKFPLAMFAPKVLEPRDIKPYLREIDNLRNIDNNDRDDR